MSESYPCTFKPFNWSKEITLNTAADAHALADQLLKTDRNGEKFAALVKFIDAREPHEVAVGYVGQFVQKMADRGDTNSLPLFMSYIGRGEDAAHYFVGIADSTITQMARSTLEKKSLAGFAILSLVVANYLDGRGLTKDHIEKAVDLAFKKNDTEKVGACLANMAVELRGLHSWPCEELMKWFYESLAERHVKAILLSPRERGSYLLGVGSCLLLSDKEGGIEAWKSMGKMDLKQIVSGIMKANQAEMSLDIPYDERHLFSGLAAINQVLVPDSVMRFIDAVSDFADKVGTPKAKAVVADLVDYAEQQGIRLPKRNEKFGLGMAGPLPPRR